MGCPKEATIRSFGPDTRAITNHAMPVTLEEGCIVSNHVTLYEGATIGASAILEDYSRVGYLSVIGASTRVMYGAYICDRVTIGKRCRIAGFVCDGTVVDNDATVLGSIVHEYANPHAGWWDVDEEPPQIAKHAVVAYGATVVGPARIGEGSYIAAGATVTRDVPPNHVVIGANKQIHAAEWHGRRLQGFLALDDSKG